MSLENLATYLNDHDAGSVAALELLDHCISKTAGTPLHTFFSDLRREVQADQEILRELMNRMEIKQSAVRKATAWVAEKFGWAKFNAAGTDEEDAGLLETLEFLYLGITGKAALWRALMAIHDAAAPLREFDLAHLLRRAEAQRAQVEERRIAAAKKSLSPTSL